MKFLKFLFGLFIIMVVVAVLVGGYFGFVPGVSALFGSNKARDLGVRASTQAYDQGNADIGWQRQTSNDASAPLQYSGYHDANFSLTSEQVTSLMQDGGWKYNPIAKDFQMKIHDDGSVEISGILDIGKLKKYASITNLGDISGYAKKYGILTPTIPFYAAGTASVTNNQLSLNLTSAQAGRLSIPLTPDINKAVAGAVQQRINEIPGMKIDSLTFSQGKLDYKGTFPDKIITSNQ